MQQHVPAFGFAKQHPFHAADGLAAQAGHLLCQAEEFLPARLKGLLIMVGDCPTIIKRFEENNKLVHPFLLISPTTRRWIPASRR